MRTALIVIGAVGLVCGLASLAFGVFPPMFVFGFWGVILVIGTIFERVIYKPNLAERPGPGYQRTTERFIDDQTGETVTVYVEPATGERAYVRD
ncbi:MAG: hypothetical protein ISS15_05560 [Alphaproteobacteria bacterium]|nr:hypothetical protein [Alphaproteobacteria bacterium]MBL6939413.1 hypothetical protein [Alphaproteobacteria bacterium]MBL7097106.1 hypothetical protein [Alphaproteobacteria bacterium]